jgi:hypothetical protein
MVESMGISAELSDQGKLVMSAPLHPVATSTCLRVREGRRLITDGPFAETTEQLGGFYILDVADLDEALAIASRLPPVTKGTIEIRPIYDVSHLEPLVSPGSSRSSSSSLKEPT